MSSEEMMDFAGRPNGNLVILYLQRDCNPSLVLMQL